MSKISLSDSIRSKKKKLKDMESRDVIDDGGSPSMDKQDIDIMDRDLETKRMGLDHNDPKERSEEPSNDDMSSNDKRSHQDPSDAGIEMDMAKKRKMRLKAALK